MQCVRDRNESTVVFERRSVIARPVLGSMQNILTIHALVWQPKQMHTKSIRTVFPVKKPKKFGLEMFRWKSNIIIILPATQKSQYLQCQSHHLSSCNRQRPKNSK